MKTTTQVFKTVPEQIGAMADYFVSVARESIASRDIFNVVLSGGQSPVALYTQLASHAYKDQVKWDQVNFFFGDERHVPANDPDNNAFMVKRTLFDPLNIPDSKIFAVDTSLSPGESAQEYAQTIAAFFKGQGPRFDLIILGMGSNAHTASLFPDTPILKDHSATVQAVYLKSQNVYRISMTAPMINRARHIAFLVYGREKAEAVYHVLEGDLDPQKYPAQLIHPDQGSLRWFLDAEAATLLME
jgi:6-phosphogluconolactonase